jgi:hypothetical protein
MVRLAQVVTAASQATVTFSSIPATYTSIKVIATGRDTNAGVNDTNVRLLFNGDTTAADYMDTQQIGSSNGSTFSGSVAQTTAGCVIGFIPGTLTSANAFGSLEVTIPYYAQTTFFKSAFGVVGEQWGQTSVGNTTVGTRWFSWLNTAAVNAMTFTAGGTAFTNGSIFTLYGIA